MNADVVAKIERAIEHRDALQVEQVAARELRAHKLIFEHNHGEDTNPMCWAQWRVDDPGEPLPLRLGLILGDLVHNLRSALEYAAWSAATDEARRAHWRDLQFPLCTSKRAFAKLEPKLSRLYPSEVVEVFERSQPFRAPSDQMHPLGVLQALSNGDKHRVLQVLRRAQIPLNDVTIEPAPSGGIVSTVSAGPIEAGKVVARIEFPRPPTRKEIVVRGEVAWYEAVRYEHQGEERWLRIDEMLNAICPEVLETVTAVGYMAEQAAQ